MQSLSRFCLLFLSFWFVNLARGQLISFSVKNESLEKVFLLVEQQSDYRFIYSNEILAKAKPVSLVVSNETLTAVLDSCLKGSPLTYAINEKHVLVKMKSEIAAARTLKGKVVTQTDEPVIGASVAVKYTSLITATDNEGAFTFDDVPSAAILVVSGAEIESSETNAGNKSEVLVRVRGRMGELDETIVIAYGRTSRRQSMETLSKVAASEINRQPVSNPLAALAGRVSGLQVTQASGVPGSALTVRVRGRNSMVNGNDPLYIVDGVPFPGTSLSDVLGGGGGVSTSPLDNINPDNIESIAILKDAAATAIYGSRGANGVILITTKKGTSGKPVVRLKTWTGFGRITRRLDMLTSPEYLQMRREAFSNDAATPTVASAPDLLVWDTTRYTDWQEEMIGHTQTIQDLNISLSGGSGQTQFLTGASYYRSTTVYPGASGQDKKTGILSITHSSENKRFTLSASASWLAGKIDLPKEDLTIYARAAPVAPKLFNEDGSLNWSQSTWTNPWSRILQTFTTRTETFTSNLQLAYRVLPGLHVRFSAGYTSLMQREHYITPLSSINPASGSQPSASFGSKQIRTLIAEPQLQYTASCGHHKWDLLAGSTLQQDLQNGLYQTGTGYANDALLNSLSSAAAISLNGESNIKYRYAAIFGRLNYGYRDKYLASVTIRRDGSSRYGPSNRFATFGSFGLGWVFTQEDWMKKIPWLSFGKLKITAGITGNDQIGDYKYLDLYGPYLFSYQGVPTYIPSQLFSPGYGWEQVRKIESALDIGLFSNRLTLSIAYYHNTTNNQLVSYPLPGTTGFTGILKNLPAVIRNSGWEIEGDWHIIRQSDWQWRAGFNVTIPSNKLVSFENFATSSYAGQYVIGKPLSTIKVFRYDGVDAATGLYSFTDANNDGRISGAADQVSLINTALKWFGGITQELTYHRWSLHAHFQFSAQPHGRNYLPLFTRPGTLTNQPTDVLAHWTKPGQQASAQLYSQGASLPATAYSNLLQSDAIYTNASYLRLRNLQIEYAWAIAKLTTRFFIQGQNLVTITPYEGLDPETQSQLPPMKVWAAGIQLQF